MFLIEGSLGLVVLYARFVGHGFKSLNHSHIVNIEIERTPPFLYAIQPNFTRPPDIVVRYPLANPSKYV